MSVSPRGRWSSSAPLEAVWTSNVSNTSYSSASGATVTVNTTPVGPNQVHYFSTGTNIVPNPQYGTGLPTNQWPGTFPGQIQVQTPSQPLDGYIATINGKVYRYSAALNEWHEVVDAPAADIASAEPLPIILDASEMLVALKSYFDFLNDLDGLDQETGNAVDDALFGLEESIRALEKLGQK